MTQRKDTTLNRRDFVKATGTVAALTGLASIAPTAFAQSSDTIRIGLIGCGGRGTGAAFDNLRVNEGVELIAMGDLFPDRVQNAYNSLSDANNGVADKVKVDDNARYVGFDAYQKVIDHPGVDLIIHATPPGFRPDHMLAAVQAGKHVFVEKPTCVDPAGYRKNLQAHQMAAAQGTAMVTGTLYRRQESYAKAIQQIQQNNAIGDITGGQAYYMAGALWSVNPQDKTPIEWQLRNWLYFNWLAGDHINEQAIHNIDVINWVMGGPPVRAYGSGGRIARTDKLYGEIYDHFSITYEYENGAKIDFKCRQQANTRTNVSNRIYGSKGFADINPGGSAIFDHTRNRLWNHRGRGNNAYQTEHFDLVNSIRAGEPIVEFEQTANSSLTAIMGRFAAYAGAEVEWQNMTQYDQDLWPNPTSFDDAAPEPVVAIPGQWQLPGLVGQQG